VKTKTDSGAFERYKKDHARCLGIAAEQLRTEKGLTRSEVAKRANVSVLWIQKLETNQLHTNYSIGRLDQLTRALGVELYDLYKRAGDMTGPPPWLTKKGKQDDE
jgi:transcriptional regulator with XRE-family HTH domain